MFFYNVSNITLGGAFAFQKTAPIFITLIAFVVFKENIGIKGWIGILIAFGGVLLIAQPWAHNLNHSGFDLKKFSYRYHEWIFSRFSSYKCKRT